MSAFTPMMRQYLAIKRQYADAILFFRLGDFYEMFFEDALLASRVLEIALTARDGGKEKVPMCGVPYHAADSYIAKLINQGYKVAICEQLEDPRLAKGIVKREVVRVITPGTVVDEKILAKNKNNYLLALCGDDREYGLAYVDISTGEFKTSQFRREESSPLDEITRLRPAECIVLKRFQIDQQLQQLFRQLGCSVNWWEDKEIRRETSYRLLTDYFQTFNLQGFGCENLPLAIQAAGMIIKFLQDTQKQRLAHLTKLVTYQVGQRMSIDLFTRRNLELVETIRTQSRRGSLLGVLDETVTAMGARKLQQWLEAPLIKLEEIKKRLQVTEEFFHSTFLRENLRQQLKGIFDLERLLGKISYGTANAKDLISLKQSIGKLPGIAAHLKEATSPGLVMLRDNLDPLEDLGDLLERALHEDPPASIKEGEIIKDGYNPEVDRLRQASLHGKQWLADLEVRERERTGIKSLKIGFNRVFGYYIEVTRSNLDLVPGDYQRKQTLANAERFITPELKEKEALILGAEEKLNDLEFQLFQEIRDQIAAASDRIQATAQVIAQLDVFTSLASVAVKNGYCKPEVNDSFCLELIEARHPVVEAISGERFVANDVYLHSPDAILNIITGPNMAGKSTYIRMPALICIMAQMGSFVPAKKAVIGIVDRVFARVGASDDLSTGQSTFMVEMNEVAHILNHASQRSLIVLDEVGRGTSTYDGISIAWAVSEYIVKKIRARTLFATHYHELTQLEDQLPSVRNLSMAVQEKGGKIVFLRKVVPGGADRSYGIHVAQLAGLPPEVIAQATQVLKRLGHENGQLRVQKEMAVAEESGAQEEKDGQRKDIDSFLTALLQLDVDRTTPIQALNALVELREEAGRLLQRRN